MQDQNLRIQTSSKLTVETAVHRSEVSITPEQSTFEQVIWGIFFQVQGVCPKGKYLVGPNFEVQRYKKGSTQIILMLYQNYEKQSCKNTISPHPFRQK